MILVQLNYLLWILIPNIIESPSREGGVDERREEEDLKSHNLRGNDENKAEEMEMERRSGEWRSGGVRVWVIWCWEGADVPGIARAGFDG